MKPHLARLRDIRLAEAKMNIAETSLAGMTSQPPELQLMREARVLLGQGPLPGPRIAAAWESARWRWNTLAGKIAGAILASLQTMPRAGSPEPAAVPMLEGIVRDVSALPRGLGLPMTVDVTLDEGVRAAARALVGERVIIHRR